MGWFERQATAWLARWHGSGDEHQYRYYRCEGCKALVTWRQIKAGGCPCGTSSRVKTAALSLWEKFRCLCLPWTVGQRLWASPSDTAHVGQVFKP
mgnify:CR=1 FL=1